MSEKFCFSLCWFLLVLTVFVDDHGEELSVERADVEEHGGTLERPEAQGHVLSSQRHVGVDGGRNGAAVPDLLVRLLEAVADGGRRLEAGGNLWGAGKRSQIRRWSTNNRSRSQTGPLPWRGRGARQ